MGLTCRHSLVFIPSFNPYSIHDESMISSTTTTSNRLSLEHNEGLDIFIAAGEASGDLHGAHLVKAIHEQSPHCRVFGLGGSALAVQGAELIVRNDDIAVTGIIEVASHFRAIRAGFHRLLQEAGRRRPALAILIDYPDFNLRLAAKLKRLGIPIMYYISPQLWAWRRGRIRTIKRHVDHMVVILPFEAKLYADAGIPVTFVGHPLKETVHPSMTREEFFAAIDRHPDRPLVTLLPGSRRKEVVHHLPVLASAVTLLKRPIELLIAKAPTVDRALIESLAPGIRILEDGIYDALAYSDVVATSCGTATLETALSGTPMITFYRLSRLTYFLGRPLVRMKTFAMCNILAGRRIVPELIQENFTPERVASELEKLLAGDRVRQEMRAGLEEIREQLGPPGAASRAAAIALGLAGHDGK